MYEDILFLENIRKKEKREKMDFTKFRCPVCNKDFNENDDVVVCPECGTPHHRECYKATGKCFNEALHGSNKNLREECRNSEAHATENIPQSKDERKDDNSENPFKFNVKGIPDFIRISTAQDTLIEGKHATLFEAAVGKNQKYYIPKFAFMSSFKKGMSFNFIAFFAPLAWSFYRKMYKISALIFAAYALLFGLVFYNFYTDTDFVNAVNECAAEMQKNPELYEDFQMLINGESAAEMTAAQKNLVNAMNDVSYPLYLSFLTYIVPYIPKICMGLFGNKLYLKKLTKNIDDAEKKGIEGDKLKSYLFKKYGTTPVFFAVIIGFLELLFM